MFLKLLVFVLFIFSNSFNFINTVPEKISMEEKELFQDTIANDKLDILENNYDSLENEVSELVFEKTYASWYGVPYHGRKSASGEIFNMDSLTCAGQVKITGKKGSGRLLEFGDILKITNLNNNKIVYVRVNDTGPLTPKRKIDLSKKAMDILEGIYEGVIPIKVEKIIK